MGPKILSTTPATMGSGISVTTALVVEFSAAMDEASVSVTLTPMVAFGAATWNEAHTQATFTHDEPFAFATQYTVRVAGADPMARKLTGDTVFAFTTAEPPETTPPTLLSSTPASGSTGVLAATTLVLVFSEKMDTGSVGLATLPLFDWGTPVWSVDDTTATFTPPLPLSDATTYAITVSGADVAGNPLDPTTVTLGTGAMTDTTAPTVVSTSPSAGSTGISPNVQPSVSFSEAMSAAALSVSPDAGCTPLLDATNTLLTCTHAGLLAPSTMFTVTVSGTQSKDLAMNPMAQDFTFSFTTGATADTTPPVLLSMVPSDGGIGVSRFPTLVATFNEPMDKSSTQGAVTVVSPAGKQLFYAWNDGGTAVSVTVDGGFAYGQAVTWSVGTAAKDLAGQALAAARTTGFTVRRLCSDARLKSETATDGTVFSVSMGSSRPAYTYVPSQNRARVGRYADSMSETLCRGLYVFPFGSATGCSTTGVGRDVLAVTSATLRGAQTAVTGAPYGMLVRAGSVDIDWLPVDVNRFDAGVLYTEASPCLGASCTKTFSSTGTTGHKSADVTAMVQAAVSDLRGQSGYKLTLRLTNSYAERITTKSSDYSDFTDGFAPDGGAVLDVSYEYP